MTDPTPEQMWAAIQLAVDDELIFVAEDGGVITPALLCNDFFVPAADAEDIVWNEVPGLRDLYFAGGSTALLKWIAKRRGVPYKHWRKGP